MTLITDVNTEVSKVQERSVNLKRWGRKLKQRLRGIPQVVGYQFEGSGSPSWEGLMGEDGTLMGVACKFRVFFDKDPSLPVDVTFLIPARSPSTVDQLLTKLIGELLMVGRVTQGGEEVPTFPSPPS